MYILKSAILLTCFAVVFFQAACTKTEKKETVQVQQQETGTASVISNRVPTASNVPVPVAVAKVQPSPKPRSSDVLFNLPFNLPPTEEQKNLIVKLKQQYAASIEKQQEIMASIYTEEQKKARAEASVKANSAGLKGKEHADFVNKTVPPTPEQKARFDAAQVEMTKYSTAIQNELRPTLTDEQRAIMAEESKKFLNANAPASTPSKKASKSGSSNKVKPKF